MLLATALASLVAVAPPPPAKARPAAPAPAPAVWVIDAAHSDLTFSIRHFVSKVKGTFKTWSGTITGDPPAWKDGAVDVTIQAASIDTNNEKRDGHLKSDEFFDVAKYPTLTFKSTGVEVKGSTITLKGNLTMHGVTKPVTLTGEYLGTFQQNGRQKIGFNAATKVNRLDYGITWNRAAEGGGLTLGDEVTIEVNIEATRQATS